MVRSMVVYEPPEDSVTGLRTAALSRKGALPRDADTIAKARALRAEYAQAAAYRAYRGERARAASHYAEAARWTEGYRRTVARCRLLGEVIRGESRGSPTGTTASTVPPLATPDAAEDFPTTGEAA
jgi:hypothetical protein